MVGSGRLGTWVLGLVVCLGPGSLCWSQQVFEREAQVQGPRGNTIDRRLRVERTPGSVTRELEVRRPGGTYQRTVTIPTGRPPVMGPGPVTIERNVIVQGNGGGLGPVGGFAVPFVGGLLGAAVGNALTSPPPPPPPLVMVPAVPPPVFVPAQPVPAPPPPPSDALAAEVERLQSWSGNTRVEAAMVMGRLGDPRAVPHLVRALRGDHKDEVREYAAWALGMIGDPSGRPYLEVAATRDSKRKVREAAEKALSRMDEALQATVPARPEVYAEPAVGEQPGSSVVAGRRSAVPPPPPEPVLPIPR